MTEREEIDMLRRLVADLTERVRTLEARPAPTIHVGDHAIHVTPMLKPIEGPAPNRPGTGGPIPPRPVTTCVARQDGGMSWLAQSRGEA